jgi:hypothetical protein
VRGHSEGALGEVKKAVWAGMAGRFGQTLDGRVEQRGSSGGYCFPATVGHSVMARWSSWGAGVCLGGCRGRVTCRAGCGAVSRHTGGESRIHAERTGSDSRQRQRSAVVMRAMECVVGATRQLRTGGGVCCMMMMVVLAVVILLARGQPPKAKETRTRRTGA